MKLIVGLGNPEEKYENTRHNLGFIAVDSLLKHFEPLKNTYWETDKKNRVVFKKIHWKDKDFFLIKPQLFMNNSGFAIASFMNYYRVSPEEMAVIYDDSDLPLGKIRVRFGGAAGGHKGVQSIIDRVETDKFLRIRFGIGNPMDEKLGKKYKSGLDDYVLSPFGRGEKNKVKHMINETIRIITLIFEHGVEKYMSKYNKEASSG